MHGNYLWADKGHNVHSNTTGEAIPIEAGFLQIPYPAYREIGFGLENLTPFISPLNLAVHFTWQLTHDSPNLIYLTRDFRFNIGVNLR